MNNSCTIDWLSTKTIPQINSYLRENWIEKYDVPEKAPSYVSTFVNDDSSGNLIENLGKKMIDIGGDFENYIETFEKVYFKKFNDAGDIGSRYGDISGYNNTEDKFVIAGTLNGVEHILGALPRSNSTFINTKSLLDKLVELFTSGPTDNKISINKSKLKAMIRDSYEGKIHKANPVSLSKNTHSIESQTLANLKLSYGENYHKIFSEPYIVTGRFSLSEDYSGRSVIFYNKFPSNGETVDQIIARYGGQNRVHQDKMLGMIPLDNSNYSDLNELLADVEKYSAEGIKTNTGMFANSNSLVQFFNEVMRTKVTRLSELDVFLTNFEANVSVGFDRNKENAAYASYPDPKNFIRYIQELRDLHLAGVPHGSTDFYLFLNDKLKSLVATQNNNFNGIYINPLIVKNSLEFRSGLAKIQDPTGKFANEKLLIQGLSPNVIQPQRMEFKFTDTQKDINELLSEYYENTLIPRTAFKPFDYGNTESKDLGKKLEQDNSHILSTFDKYGIYGPEINMFIKKLTTNALLYSNSSSFTENIKNSLDILIENNGDCI